MNRRGLELSMWMRYGMNSYWLHGWATDRLVFKEVIDRLPALYKRGANACDLPGFGAAAPLGQGESYAGRILSQINAEEHTGEDVALVGWSLGALVALEVAYVLGTQLGALVLISAGERFSRRAANPHGTDRRRLEVMCRSLRRQPREVLEEFYRGMFDHYEPGGWERFRLEFWPRYRNQSPEPLTEGLSYLARVDLSDLTSRITTPVLILHGKRDRVIDPRLARTLERTLPNAALVVFDSAGHMPFLGREEEFAELIGDFFKANTPG